MIFLTLYFPFVTQGATASPPPRVPSEVETYALQVLVVRARYLSMINDLGGMISSLTTNPLLIRQASFNEKLKQISKNIRLNTNSLAHLHSPPPVESIHENLVHASDIFDASAFEIERFAGGHSFDDYANAYELLFTGLGIWEAAFHDLQTMVGPPS
jgi:hypothetical protein